MRRRDREPGARMSANHCAAAVALAVATMLAGCASSDHPNLTGPGSAVPSISGVVFLPRGAPAARAEVTLSSDPVAFGGLRPYFGVDTTTSAGEFAFSVPAGVYDLMAGIRSAGSTALQPPYDSLVAIQIVTVESSSKPVSGVHLTLQPAGVFRGRTTYSGAAPAPIVSVLCLEIQAWADIDTVGPYLLKGIPPGTWHVAAAGFSGNSIAIATSPPVAMSGPGDTVTVADLDVTLPPTQPANGSPPALHAAALRLLEQSRATHRAARAGP